MQKREALLLEALGAKLGVVVPRFAANGGEAFQLLQRCGPLPLKSSESGHSHSRASFGVTAHPAPQIQAKGLVSSNINQSTSVLMKPDEKLAVDSSAPWKRVQPANTVPPESKAALSLSISAPLDPVRRHCAPYLCSLTCSKSDSVLALHSKSAAVGPGTTIGAEWRLVRMVRERVPVDLLQRLSPDAEYESVFPIFERLLHLVVKRLQV